MLENGAWQAPHRGKTVFEGMDETRWKPLPVTVKFYDPSKYDTYLEQLGITYPTVRK